MKAGEKWPSLEATGGCLCGDVRYRTRGTVDVCAGTLDDPNAILPQEHIFTDHKCAWLHLDDGLPRHRRFPPGYEDLEPKWAGERP